MSGLLLLYTELTLFCIELPENCIFLNPSELSNFFMCIINMMITIIIIILIMTIMIIKIIFKTWLFVDMEFFL